MDQWLEREHVAGNFDYADLRDVVMRNCRFTSCSFHGALLSEGETDHSIFTDCDFSSAQLGSSVHRRSAFLNCSFRMARLFNVEFRACKMTGSTFDEADLSAISIVEGDRSYVNLRFQDLSGRQLRKVRLVEADFSEGNLAGADLRDADLTNANLANVRLRGADLRGATIEGIALSSLDLRGVRLDLSQAVALAQALGARAIVPSTMVTVGQR